MRKCWTKYELEFIKNNAEKLKDKELAQELTKISGRVVTVAAVRKQRHTLKIKKEPGRGVSKIKSQTLPSVGRAILKNESNN